jgi:hypothetical protein
MNLYKSFIVRTGFIYRHLLSVLPANLPNVVGLGNSDLTLVTMCGKRDLNMLNISLQSLVQSWGTVPKIIVFSDGSLEPEQLKNELHWLKDRIEVGHWKDCLKEFDVVEESFIEKFANLDRFVGKKLAVIIANGRRQPTLWIYCDILWFKKLNTDELNLSVYIKTSEDIIPSYSKNMVDRFPDLVASPYINSGLIYISGDMLVNKHIVDLINLGITEPDHFSEQTIVAKAVHDSTRKVWPLSSVYLHLNDITSVLPSFVNKGWTARHYVSGSRHIFWRDAFFLKLGFKS